MELPGLLPGSNVRRRVRINPRGQIVGVFASGDFSVQRPVFWPNSNAAAIYLPGLRRQASDQRGLGCQCFRQHPRIRLRYGLR